MTNLKHFAVICLMAIGFALFAFADKTPAAQATVSQASEKASPATTPTVPTDPVSIVVPIKAEAVVSLEGRSTYGLSSCRPTFVAKPDTGIGRLRPLLRPPVN